MPKPISARALVPLCCGFLLSGVLAARAHAGWRSGGQMHEPRSRHTATLLKDGRVLIAGGQSDAGCLDTAELWDPRSERFRPTRPLSEAHCAHTAALLADGRVLVVGGESSRSIEVFDPAAETWRVLGAMQTGRTRASVFPLADGRVLIFGGEETADAPSVAELWEPSGGRSVGTHTLSSERKDHAGVQLADGRILIAGASGDAGTTSAGMYAEVWDAATGAWMQLTSMRSPRAGLTLTRLRDGRVVAVGGSDEPFAEVFDPGTEAWRPTRPARSGRHGHTTTLLRDGTLLVVGGYAKMPVTAAASYFYRLSLDRVERWNPADGAWTPGPPLARSRIHHTATLLPDGRVLVVGGEHKRAPGQALTVASAELFEEPAGPRPPLRARPDPPPPDAVLPGRWLALKPLLQARAGHTVTRLPDGRFLLVGGAHDGMRCSLQDDTCGHAYSEAAPELWDPRTGTSRLVGAAPRVESGHSATLLRSGQVLVAGGGVSGVFGGDASDVFRFDAATAEWQTLPALKQHRGAHAATLLADGRVLFTGGAAVKGPVASAELWEPDLGTTRIVASLGQARSGHTATLLADGRVLVAGGSAGKTQLRGTELYDPRRDLWQPGPPLTRPRTGHSALLLPDGSVLIIGGDAPAPAAPDPRPVSTAESLEPGAQDWRAAGTLASRRTGHSALLLPDGQVVVVGGTESSRVEVWEPGGRRFRRAADSLATTGATAAELTRDGRVILLGGDESGRRVQAGLSLGAAGPAR